MPTLLSIDTTPNPNSMKLNLSEGLGVTGTFSAGNLAAAPGLVQQLLALDGVQSIFAAAGFLTLNRDPRADWATLLDAARAIIDGKPDAPPDVDDQRRAAEKQGQVQVLVQTFREIPIQVKVTDGASEERAGLSARFGEAARELQAHFGADYLKERHWADWGVRYGTLAEIARDVAEEIETVMDDARLQQQKSQALGELITPLAVASKASEAPAAKLDDPDWHTRFQAVQQLEASEAALPLLIHALHDEKPQIRRWVAARLAGVKTTASVEALSHALLNDAHVGVRRTAGDSLSDIGDASAEPAACQALADSNKLVRWRAARFLAEVGTAQALPFLETLNDDPEYEVRLEAEAAIRHIQEGTNSIPVWKLMSQENEQSPDA